MERSHGPYGELELLDLSSGKVRQLTNDNALVLSPAWSPDQKFIYFASSRGGTLNVWKISAAGGAPQQITAGQGDDAQLDVSSDGKRIVFSTWRENTNIGQLDLTARPLEQAAKLVTTDPGRAQGAPVYSPDGKHLAYFSNLKGAENESIWISDADGSNPVQLVSDGRVDVFPRWTPDGQRLIYLADPDEYRSVSISGGAPETVLKLQELTDRFVDVGPDGRLLFRNSRNQIQMFDPRDKKTETYETPQASDRLEPLRWSPDGPSIAYVIAAGREGDPSAGLWIDDFKAPPRQIFHGWVDTYAQGPADQIYIVEGHPDLSGSLWKVGWSGQGLVRTSTVVPMVHSYWVDPARNPQDHFAVSPDGHHLAYNEQTVLGANIGIIESAH